MVPAVEQLPNLLLWMLALPMLGATLCAWGAHRLPRALLAVLASSALLVDFVLAVGAFCALAAQPAGAVFTSPALSWLKFGSLDISVQLRLDALSAIFLLIITGVGFLIHLFSWGYQKDAPGLGRYFAELNFFCAAMLLLVLADSLPVVFVGWEGVGLASYLLIGFSFEDLGKAAAGKKAFVVNRIGDAGFLLATFLLWGSLHTFRLHELAQAAPALRPEVATAAALLLAFAATGKSAQLPLFVWLPDAMAGPTPVSALIHAATMVTAGIYVGARTSFLLLAAPVAAMVVACVGAATALYAATCALAQTDIKRVLAYSTVSQLGYMFMALGMGAAPLALFHVATHAMFKACLFLGAGAVIHALGGLQDIRQMGGLYARLPRVAVPFGLATLAIAGVPPLAGFVSKDAILGHAFALGRLHDLQWGALGYVLYGTGLVTAFLTAFYMGRLFLLVFLSGPERLPAKARAHLHDAPPSMALPLFVLAALSVVLGLCNWPEGLGGEARFAHWLAPALGGRVQQRVAQLSTSSEILLLLASVAAGLLGLGLAWLRYGKALPAAGRNNNQLAWHALSAQAWGIDAGYQQLLARPYDTMAHEVLRGAEQRIFEGGLRGTGQSVGNASFVLALLHNGNVQRGLAVLVMGMAALMAFWLWPLGGHL